MTPPRTAYISLWFPKPSETFIFREVKVLKALGLPVRVFTLYAPLTRNLSPEMSAFERPESLGSIKTPFLAGTLAKHLFRAPAETWAMLKAMPFNDWRSLEGLGENLWAVACGLHLANRFRQEDIEHIHAPWAGGPATAAWVASRLTGIPFSFAGRAGDIYPAEGALPQKIADAAFVRVNHGVNMDYLTSFAPQGHEHKITLVYNSLSLGPSGAVRKPVPERSTRYRLLAAGRFVSTKGFPYLLDACSLLKERNLDFSLTFAGDGGLRRTLERQSARLGLTSHVEFRGFLSHDQLSELMLQSDALIMPSCVDEHGHRDGIPNVIMEAYAHGLAVVASDVAGIKEVVRNDETGFLVPQKDAVSLADAIQSMISDPAKSKALAETGRQQVLERFDPEKNGRKLIELFATHAGSSVRA